MNSILNMSLTKIIETPESIIEQIEQQVNTIESVSYSMAELYNSLKNK
jgi:hypothetical protein